MGRAVLDAAMPPGGYVAGPNDEGFRRRMDACRDR